MWRLLISFFILQTVSSCPKGFDLASEGQCRGLLYTETLYRDEAYGKAVSKCNEIEGQTVIIHNDEQQHYWQKLQNKKDGKIILGLTCDSKSKQWTWADGSPLDYLPSEGHDEALSQPCTTGCSVYTSNVGHWHVWCDHASEYVNICCTTQLPPLPTPSGDGCESFEDDSEDGVCYQIISTAENWNDADSLCYNFGAELASIHNDHENSFIRRLAVSKGAVNGLFLGGQRPVNSNNYRWSDNTKFDYDNFRTGYPKDGQGNCIVMDTQNSAGDWTNKDCEARLPAACVRKQNYKTPKCSKDKIKEGDVVTSPGFPLDASKPCDFKMMVNSDKRVQVEILLLEANSCCDRLVLYDIDDYVIANYTGELHDKMAPISYSNYVRVSWQPQGGFNVRGVMMKFQGV